MKSSREDDEDESDNEDDQSDLSKSDKDDNGESRKKYEDDDIDKSDEADERHSAMSYRSNEEIDCESRQRKSPRVKKACPKSEAVGDEESEHRNPNKQMPQRTQSSSSASLKRNTHPDSEDNGAPSRVVNTEPVDDFFVGENEEMQSATGITSDWNLPLGMTSDWNLLPESFSSIGATAQTSSSGSGDVNMSLHAGTNKPPPLSLGSDANAQLPLSPGNSVRMQMSLPFAAGSGAAFMPSPNSGADGNMPLPPSSSLAGKGANISGRSAQLARSGTYAPLPPLSLTTRNESIPPATYGDGRRNRSSELAHHLTPPSFTSTSSAASIRRLSTTPSARIGDNMPPPSLSSTATTVSSGRLSTTPAQLRLQLQLARESAAAKERAQLLVGAGGLTQRSPLEGVNTQHPRHVPFAGSVPQYGLEQQTPLEDLYLDQFRRSAPLAFDMSQRSLAPRSSLRRGLNPPRDGHISNVYRGRRVAQHTPQSAPLTGGVSQRGSRHGPVGAAASLRHMRQTPAVDAESQDDVDFFLDMLETLPPADKPGFIASCSPKIVQAAAMTGALDFF